MKKLFVSAQIALVAIACTACESVSTPTAPSLLSGLTAPVAAGGVNGGTSHTSQQAESWSRDEFAYASSMSSANQGLLEVSALEQNNGDLAEVKAFAFQILQDYSQAQSQLLDKSGNRLPQPAPLSSSDRQTLQSLSGKTGNGLDYAYVSAVIRMLNANTVALQQKGVPPGPATLATDAADSLARAQKFYFLARDLAGRLGIPVTDAGSPGNPDTPTGGSGAIFFGDED